MGSEQSVRITYDVREIYIHAVRMVGEDPFIEIYNNPLTEKFDEQRDIFLYNAIDFINQIVMFCTIEKSMFERDFEASECAAYIFDLLMEDSCFDSDEVSTELTETYLMHPQTDDKGVEYWVNRYGNIIDEIRWLDMEQVAFLSHAYGAFRNQIYTNLANLSLLELFDSHNRLLHYLHPTIALDGWGAFRKGGTESRFRHLEKLRHNSDRTTITYTVETEMNVE